MIITGDHIKELNSYLTSILKYQETVDEIADHILSSLEGAQSDVSFSTALLEIMNNDFGGPEGLVLLEKQSEKLVAKKLNDCFLRHLSAYLRFPKFLHVVALLVIFYYIQSTYDFTLKLLVIVIYSIAIVPSIMYLMRYFYSGYFTGSTKKSIKDKSIALLGSRSIAIANPMVMLPLIITEKSQLSAIVIHYPIIVSLLFVLLSVYVLSFIQLNQTEIKRYMIKGKVL